MSGVLVLAEHREGALRDASFETMAAGRQLAEALGTDLSAVLLGGTPEMAQLVADRGVKVRHARHELLAAFNSEAYQRALVALVQELASDAVLMPHSSFGNDLGPSLAVALGCGAVSDCIGFEKTDAGLKVTRGMYASKLHAEVLVPELPLVAMVRQSEFKQAGPGDGGAVEAWDPGPALAEPLRTRFISVEEVPTTGIDITKADVVIAVGRGVKEEANIAAVRELADSLGAVLAGSRPVIDAGWLEKERQVGSSGKTVKPKLYIALGISGAFQHVAGMKGAETIVAVNKDPHAPIFGVAHYGIVDDLLKVVPVLRQKLVEAK
ncbi:electron transfer flavoprotein subunit alpha/FixB family protein [candidate division WOR-3 bacterium]|nr:electron transfer flavoprotein subunit alpha/FixB family protein [candidate division WOR-3 bacterium]